MSSVVSLHVLEDLFDALESQEDSDSDTSAEELELDTKMAVGYFSNPEAPKRRTMKLQGMIANKEVLILVDSVIVATFVSDQLVAALNLKTNQCASTQYLTADGSPMICHSMILGLLLYSQGHTFSVDAGVLPLKCYDMIVGQDWLENFSPMWVHWRKKIMKFTYH